MESKPEKWERAVGVIFGILLLIIWVFALNIIFQAVFPRQNIFDIPAFVWLFYGSPLFFGFFGVYLFYNRKMGGFEAFCNLIFLKGYILGFFIWSLVTGIFFMQSGIPGWANLLGGYIIVFTVFGIWYRVASRKNPDICSGKSPLWGW